MATYHLDPEQLDPEKTKGVSSELQALKALLEQKDAIIEYQRSELRRLQESFERERGQTEFLISQIKFLRNEIESRGAENELLKKQINQLRDLLEQKEADKEFLEKQVLNLKDQIENQKAELEYHRHQILILKEQIEEKEGIIEQLKSHNRSLSEKVEKQEAELEYHRQQALTLKAELEKRESALEQAKAQIRYLKAQIEQLKASLEQATAQIKKLREIIEKQQAYAESLKIRFREIKDQLERKAAELEQQNFLLKQTYKQLEEGINYAHHIQYSLLASEEEVRQVFPESFVLYRPMQKLSGDFFLATHYKNGRLLFIGDAEGHGIPAAILCTLMYHLVENALEMRSRFSELTGATISPEEPAQILEQIRDGVKRLYQHPQTDKMKGSQPYKEHGMDASLAIYLPDQKRIYYAGANLPAVIIKKENQTIIELEPVKNPLASYYREKKFESRTYKVQSGDMLYMFSDGYYSQLINVEGREKPLGKRGFYTVLQKVASLEVSQQKQALEQIFERFKGDKEQTDDITIVGIRL